MEERYLKMKNDWLGEMAASPGIPLWPAGETPGFRPEYGQPEPSLVPFLLDKPAGPRGAVIVCPGGGYEFKAPHEGRPVAQMLNAAGIHAFVLDYRVAPYTIDLPLADLKRAIRTVRHKAQEWNIEADKIGVLGFSAGGHLCIMAAEHFDTGNPDATDPIERVSSRPDAQVPCYPVVSFREIFRKMKDHGWVAGLFAAGYTEREITAASGDLCVRANTPPAFLWGTWDDYLYEQWPPYLQALRRMKVECSFHLFPRGGHGMGLAQGNALAGQWSALCTAWLREKGF